MYGMIVFFPTGEGADVMNQVKDVDTLKSKYLEPKKRSVGDE